mgnify:CR=1 FL=1
MSSARVIPLLTLLFVLLSSSLSFGTPSYTFPQRWQALLSGSVNDCATFGKDVFSTGYYYADYTHNKGRVDEVWNVSSIQGTVFTEFGIFADTHLYGAPTKKLSYYYFISTNGTMRCLLGSSGLIPRNAFDESTFLNIITLHGQDVYVFEKTIAGYTSTLFVSVKMDMPVRLTVTAPNIPTFNNSVVNFSTFHEVEGEWADPDMFKSPSYCSPLNIYTPPSCRPSSPFFFPSE